jgi:hypothetical protein
MIDVAETFQRCAPLVRRQDERLRRIGIRLTPLDRLMGMVMSAPIAVTDRTFRLSPSAAHALITPIRIDDASPTSECNESTSSPVHYGQLVDLIAWHPDRPGKWALYTGHALALGWCTPRGWDDASDPVRVHSTVAGWFRSGCDGLFICATDPADRQRVILSVGAIRADNRDHERALAAEATRQTIRPPRFVRSMLTPSVPKVTKC